MTFSFSLQIYKEELGREKKKWLESVGTMQHVFSEILALEIIFLLYIN